MIEKRDCDTVVDAKDFVGSSITTVNHPRHYNNAGVLCPACGCQIEAIDVCRAFNFSLGNVIKYVWRAGHKGAAREDLMKARWYIDYELRRIEDTE